MIHGTLYGFDVPAVTTGEITAAGTLNGDTAIGGTGEIAEAGGKTGLATFAIVSGVVGLRFLALEHFGRFGWGKRLSFVKFVNIDGVFLWFRFLRLGLFLVETFGGVDSAAVGRSDGGLRHGNACAADQADFCGGIAATPADASPSVAGALDPDADEEECGEGNVKPGRVTEEAVEGEVVDGVGSVRHGVRTG